MGNNNITKLNNGLKIFKLNIPFYKSLSVIAIVKVGSKHENIKTNGLAHFLEHLNFRGTPKYPTANSISKILDKMGCSFNAYTTKTVTVYHFKLASHAEYINKLMDILSQILFESQHTKTDVDAERKVVMEEIKKTRDAPDDLIDDELTRLMFKGSSLELDTLGDIKTIKKIDRKTIRNFYKKYYVPNNISISMVGRVPNGTIDVIKKYFNKYPIDKHYCQSKLIPYQYSLKPELKVIHKPKSDYAHLAIGFPGNSIYDNNLLSLKLLALYIGGNMSSKLFMALREKESLVYDVSCYGYGYEEGGYLGIYTSMDIKNLNKSIKIIMTELAKIHQHKFTKEELEVLKVNKIHYKEMEWENNYNIAEYYAEQIALYPKITTTNEYIEKYKKITLKDINIAQNSINFSKMKVVVVGNIKRKDIDLDQIFKNN